MTNQKSAVNALERNRSKMNNQVIVNPGLYDLPEKVLLPLMITLNDTTLLDMTRVCKRFQAIAKEVFVKKYHGTTEDDFYGIRVYSANMNEQLKQYHPFFSAFGENMIAIKIDFLDDAENVKDHWINGLIQRYCTSLAKLVVYRGDVDLTGIIFWLPKPTLTHLGLKSMSVSNYLWADYEYSQLICFHAVEANIDQEKIEKFIGKNRQLEELRLVGEFIGIDILKAISGKLNELKRLEIHCYEYQESPEKSITIELRQLQELEIHLVDETCEPVLQSIAKGCKNVEKLEIEDEADCLVWNKEKIDAICEFVKLKSLRLSAGHLTINHIERIVQKLPNLTSLTLFHACEIYGIPQIISICSKLNSIQFIEHSEELDMLHLNSGFLCRIAETTDRNTSMKVTWEFGDKPKKIIFTQEEVRCGNAIVYWSGYDPIDNQTKTLLDLSDECLMKIIGYLDINAQAALYTTCTQTQRAIKDHLSTTVFHEPKSSNAIDEDVFQSLAPSIHKIIVTRDLSLEQWENINLHCTSLIELNMAYDHDRDLYRLNFVWPKLQKLTLTKCSPRILRSFDCPMLTHLEVHEFRDTAINSAKALYFSDWFRQLTVLKFGTYNESAEKFLMGLDDNFCQQLQEFSIGNSNALRKLTIAKDRLMKLVNTIIRCRNLTILRLIIPDIASTGMEFLFESCTKLAHFTICCTDVYNSKYMFRKLKESCQDIKSIQIVIRDSKTSVFQREFLQAILQSFPHVSLSAACVDIDFVFPITPDLIKSSLP